ncbi:HNH endonuclease domain-containing protein [Clostridium ganghwense]|uniref:HNH endonuclease n=1 Tax=Clostridium ganghwense TaxID=312089 RepID=A0ABT4CK34_9CLOT|nr:HNH endonuclease domain-containing protein [Clostridium ganghwense]MCY6369413.1 HNH endonuclease [Clostridium ganghwense]
MGTIDGKTIITSELVHKDIVTGLPSSERVEVRRLEQLLSYENLVASYKLYWFLGIYKEILEGNKEITFKRIVCRMIANAWYPLLQYHLSFGFFDNLNDVVLYASSKYGFDSTVKEKEIIERLENDDDKELNKKIKKFYSMVPYRLIAPFFKNELHGLKDSTKNRLIEILSNEREDVLYKIVNDNGERKVIINDEWFNYIVNNQAIIKGWINYKLIYFLQKKNPNVPAIPLKIEPPYTRNLGNAKKLWEYIIKENIEMKDIYTKQKFNTENFDKYGVMSIDHFIPWSFVLHDEMWNLVPTFKNINSTKSNNLVPIDKYFNDFCDMQYIAFNALICLRKDKILQEYLNTCKTLNISSLINKSESINREVFYKSLRNSIYPLYQIAYNQGYEVRDIWG